jgi:hypothetical protein
MTNIQVCNETKNECNLKLENTKAEFNQMKRSLQVITEVENEIKANLD